MAVRPYQPDDAPMLADIFRDAVMNIASKDYDEAQCHAWVRFINDLDAFAVGLSRGLTLVAEDDQGPVAFGQLHPVDHVNYIYCRLRGRGRGYADAILTALEDHANKHHVRLLYTEASRTSRPFFARRGYTVEQEEIVRRQGVLLPRFIMSKKIER
jgi:putative acetyltransferase